MVRLYGPHPPRDVDLGISESVIAVVALVVSPLAGPKARVIGTMLGPARSATYDVKPGIAR